jgi:hypothetical protein
MGNIKIFSRAGYQDLSVWRNQALTNVNSSTKMSWNDAKLDLTLFTTVVIDVFAEDNFQTAAPILSFSVAGGTIVPLDGGFYLSVPAATLDIEGNTYYYSMQGDSELLLTGKFVINEQPEQS